MPPDITTGYNTDPGSGTGNQLAENAMIGTLGGMQAHSFTNAVRKYVRNTWLSHYKQYPERRKRYCAA